jgi:hypothetical protein
MDIELEPSADTGFDLTSQPSGGLVWLDGQPLIVDDQGRQATTNFHASRIAPGVHVIEIKGSSQYQDWRQEFLQEPDRTVRLHADLVPAAGVRPTGLGRMASQGSPAPSPPAIGSLLGSAKRADKSGKDREERHGSHRGGARAEGEDSTSAGDVFENAKLARDERAKPQSSDEDIFETQGKIDGGMCIATISSKPWAEVSIDGKPTGKITPLVNYPIPCGKHRISFKNADLMIERNESVTLKEGQPFKKIFSLVENDL